MKNPEYSPKQLEDQWINTIFANHDLICGCNDTITHLLVVLNRKGTAPKPEKDIKNIKCLITGKEEEDHTEEDAFGAGELELLFKEDGDEEEDGAAGGSTG